MKQDDFYFAQELQEIKSIFIPTSFGNIYSVTAGMPGQPLILIVHGSGPKNSSDQYNYILQEYLVRISYLSKFYLVAIDCPGYGQSKGSKQAVKTFPLKMFREILSALKYKNYFALFGHSQGGSAIFHAIHEDPSLADYLIMERPVCGNIQRFRKFEVPTLLIYDIQDDGHPIWQGKQLYKELANTQMHTYRNSNDPYWVPDNIWDKMLGFFSNQNMRKKASYNYSERKSRINKSQDYAKRLENRDRKYKQLKKTLRSVDKAKFIDIEEKKEEELQEIQQVEKSQLFSITFEKYEKASGSSSSNYEKSEKMQQKSERQSFVFQEKSICFKNEKEQERYKTPMKEEVFKSPRKKEQIKINNKKSISQIKIEQKEQEIEKEKKMEKEEINIDKCSICFEIYFRPIVTNCSHTFCTRCILQSLLVNQKCPLCRAKIVKKTENKQLHQQIIEKLSEKEINRRQKQLLNLQTILKSIISIQIGNTSKQLETKQSIFTKTKKKYIWQIFVKPPKSFPLDEVSFNINMGNDTSKPIRVRNAPFVFESRGTFSFACEITIKPRNKQYGDLISIYTINIEPGTHHKTVNLKKKIHMK